ncbi:MAG: hypothetical protein MUO64_19125 [Anaerolineales bacterium]|nr:hypothetical protein [Anaerolineales bacterium]
MIIRTLTRTTIPLGGDTVVEKSRPMPAVRAAFLIPMDSASAFDSPSDRNCLDINLMVKKKPNTCTIAIIARINIVFEWERILGALAAMIAQIKTNKSIAMMEPSHDFRVVIILGVSF